MRLGVMLSFWLAFLIFVDSCVFAEDLGDAFNRAREIVESWKPSPSNDSNRSRDEREERRSESVSQNRPGQTPVAQDTEKQQREQVIREREVERQRIQENLRILDANLVSAGNIPKVSRPISGRSDDASISAREQQLDALMHSENTLAALRLASAAKEEARGNAKLIQDAITRRGKPPFKALWDFYKYNRPTALGLLPNENRCALVMSMTLGLEPRTGEISLGDLGNKQLIASLSGPIKTMLLVPIKDSEIAKKYYVRADELAHRLKTEFGTPVVLEGTKARDFISGKKGIVFRTGITRSHLDLWDSDHLAAGALAPFEMAREVWFWEMR